MGQGEHLRELVRSMGWSYAVLWSIPPLMTELVWTDGWYEHSNLKTNVERQFNASYKTCSFAPGYGYVGKVFTQGQHIWLTGDPVYRQSITPGQANFFESAGIQTLLCFPWFNGVVELGSETLVSQNEDLLQRIRRFLSNTPASLKLPQHLKSQADDGYNNHGRLNSMSPSEGPHNSQGISSDETEGNLSDSTLNQPVDSCSSFSVGDRLLRQQFRLAPIAGGLESYWGQQGPAVAVAAPEVLLPGNPMKAAGHGHNSAGISGADWRLDFSSDLNNLTSSPTSTLQQAVFTPLAATEHEEFESSFLVSSSTICSPLNQQAKSLQQQLASKPSASVDNPSSQHFSTGPTPTPNATTSQSEVSKQDHRLSRKMAPPAFKPWKGQKHAAGAKRHKNQHNQVLLQRSINMVHQISLLTQNNQGKKEEKIMRQRNDQMPLTIRRASEAREVHSCHDEAAINHMLAERKRREKQKENFSALRALIPFVSKMDRASILGDAIQYVKQLKSRVLELETINRELESQVPNRQRKPNSSV